MIVGFHRFVWPALLGENVKQLHRQPFFTVVALR